MTGLHYIMCGICFLILGWLLWMEFRRSDRSFRMMRMIATFFAVAALTVILLPLTYDRRTDTSIGKEGVLATEGYDPDSLKSWLQDHPEQKPTTPEEYVTSGNLSTLHVFGFGLTKQQWAELDPPLVVLHPSPGPCGILAADWQRRLLPGQSLRVQGAIKVPNQTRTDTDKTGRPFKLLLTGVGSVLDSTSIGGASTSNRPDPQPFQLETIPAQMNAALYHLILLDGKDTLEREDIPVEVLPGKPLNILMLAASPGWESSFLQKWLTKTGQGVAMRTAVSRDKFDVAFVHLPPTSVDHLTAGLLDHFDIVIADAPVLSSLTGAERSALRRSISDRGLGLITRIDSAGKPMPESGGADPIEIVTTKDSARTPFIKDRPGLQPLYRDSGNRIQVAACLYGKGKMIFTTRNATWSQSLAGESKAYAAYWSELLQTAAGENEPGNDWEMQPAFPVIGDPVHARLETPSSPQPSVTFAAQSTALAQDPVFPFFWRGNHWPAIPGWQFTRTTSVDSTRWFVWPANAWQALRRRQRWKETRQYIASQRGPLNKDNSTGHSGPAAKSYPASERGPAVSTPVPKAIFFTIFIVCLGFLWAERKMEWMSGRIVR